jgi:hypothetical protein
MQCSITSDRARLTAPPRTVGLGNARNPSGTLQKFIRASASYHNLRAENRCRSSHTEATCLVFLLWGKSPETQVPSRRACAYGELAVPKR